MRVLSSRLLVCALLLVTAACPQTGGTGSEHGSTARTIAAAPLPATAETQAAPAVELINARRYGAQLAASQSAEEAAHWCEAIRRQSLGCQVLKAELPGRGTWHRVIVGDHGWRALARQDARRAHDNTTLRALLPPVDPDMQPYLIRDDLPRWQVSPRAAHALHSAVGARSYRAALISTADGSPRTLLLAIEGDVRLRRIDATGGLLEPLPSPSYRTCQVCARLAVQHRVRSVDLHLVEDLDGQPGDELMVRYNHGEATIEVLLRLQGAQVMELGAWLQRDRRGVEPWLGSWLPVEIDGSAGVELLAQGYRLSVHEGRLCDLRRESVIEDLGPTGVRALPGDAGWHALDQATQRALFAGLLSASMLQPAGDMLVVAMAQLAALPSLATRPGVLAELLERLDQLKGTDAWRLRLAALATLIEGQRAFAVTLAAQVLDALQATLVDPAVGVPQRGCDERDLGELPTFERHTLQALADRAPSARDLRLLNDRHWTTLAAVYPASTPAGQALDRLLDRLKPAGPLYQRVRAQMREARGPGTRP